MNSKNIILIADVNEENRFVLSELLDENYTILESNGTANTLEIISECISQLLLIILNINFAAANEFDMMMQLKAAGILQKIPVVLVTSDNLEDFDYKAYELGASDVIRKPFNRFVTKRRIETIIDLYRHKNKLEVLLEKQSKQLKSQAVCLTHQTDKIHQFNDIMIDTLSTVIEYRNLESGQHIKRIRHFTKVLLDVVAKNCPEYKLTPQTIGAIASAAAIHDIGKIAIPDSVLLKPGKLTVDEFETMKLHTIKGCEILSSLDNVGDSIYMAHCHDICMYHHEKWDGKGYPKGLSGDDIPISAQVVSLADCYDALTSERVYKPAYTHDQAVEMICNGGCGKFSAKLLSCFKLTLSALDELGTLYSDNVQISSADAVHTDLPQVGCIGDPFNPLDQAKQFAKEFLHLYVKHRNFPALIAMLEKNISWVGTGADEIFHSLAQAVDFFQCEQESWDGSFNIVTEWYQSVEIAANAFVVYGILELVENTELAIPMDMSMRLSMICKLTPDGFKMFHLHASLPNEDQSEGEFVPKRITRDYNHLLQQTLDQRSKELTATSRDLQVLTESLPGGVLRCLYDETLTIDYISAGLLTLLGYSKKQLQIQFSNQYNLLVFADDRYDLKEQLQKQLSKGDLLEMVYRMQCADGRLIWVLNRGSVILNDEGEKYLLCALIDITDTKLTQEELKISEQRYRIISENLKDIIFDYDMATKIIVHTQEFERTFGYTPLTENFPQSFVDERMVHPDDAALFLESCTQATNGAAHQSFDLRIIKSDGSYLWCRVQMSCITNSMGRPTRIVGKVVDIDSVKREKEALLSKSQRDALTGLFNTAATKNLIENFLFSQDQTACHTLYIIDIDNFKSVNDTMGHLFGDAVLSEIAFELQKQFRSTDIIGRIGGDEFLAFVKDLSDESLIEAKAQDITEILHKNFSAQELPCKISASVGVARYPIHGKSYIELFEKADQAMYFAKSHGKDAYFIYDNSLAQIPMNETTCIPKTETPSLDVSGVPQKPFTSNASEYIFKIFYESYNIYTAVNAVLSLIGQYANASRAYIFENSDDHLMCSCTFEWCNESVVPQKELLQNIPYSSLGKFKEMFDQSGVFYSPDIRTLDPALRDMLVQQGIVSLLHVAILEDGVFKGFIGFDDCFGKMFPKQESVHMLKLVAHILSTFLIKQRTQDKLSTSLKITQAVMDNLNFWMYVINLNTFELLFVNKKTQALAPDVKIGNLCYKAFHGKSSPCEQCPMMMMGDQRDRYEMKIHNEYFDLWTNAAASRMPWIDGTQACLIFFSDATPDHEETV